MTDRPICTLRSGHIGRGCWVIRKPNGAILAEVLLGLGWPVVVCYGALTGRPLNMMVVPNHHEAMRMALDYVREHCGYREIDQVIGEGENEVRERLVEEP